MWRTEILVSRHRRAPMVQPLPCLDEQRFKSPFNHRILLLHLASDVFVMALDVKCLVGVNTRGSVVGNCSCFWCTFFSRPNKKYIQRLKFLGRYFLRKDMYLVIILWTRAAHNSHVNNNQTWQSWLKSPHEQMINKVVFSILVFGSGDKGNLPC